MASIRELRVRIKSVNSTKKITKAMQMIATSRIAKAQARVAAARPYAVEITDVLTTLASGSSNLDSPLLVPRPEPKRAGVLVVTGDKGLCGGYNSNALKTAEELCQLLRSQGKTPVVYVIGRRGASYYSFRGRSVAGAWTGFADKPTYEDVAKVGSAMVDAFLAGADDEGDHPGPDGILGVDELHIVYTEFISMLTQNAVARQLAPMQVEYTGETNTLQSAYEFEPSAEQLLNALLPKYINTRIFAALLESAASFSAAQRQAMQSATDNASELVKNLSREMNQARQAQITQEISEIVGGANALAGAGSDE
ncbi:F0F1 ATP synthase subunit gamma [Pseudonocardiaceae bacterium YIM PH 21723]|nr:F0F1 ATP synthase subunit gamma [Pseudonocardiaceae bacterium YIM PH 21723]